MSAWAAGLDALDDDAELEVLAEAQHGVHEPLHLRVLVDADDERAVDLQRRQRDLVQMSQRGVARPEVVEGQRDAGLAQLVGDLASGVEVGQQAVLGDLDDQLVGRKVVPRNGIGQLSGQVEVDNLVWRDVDRDLQPVMAEVSAPGGQLRAGLLQHARGELANQARSNGDGNHLLRWHERALVVPAGEGLETADAAAAQVHDRLEERPHVAGGQGLSQRLAEHQVLGLGQGHAAAIALDLAFAGPLRGVHRDVGLAEQGAQRWQR